MDQASDNIRLPNNANTNNPSSLLNMSINFYQIESYNDQSIVGVCVMDNTSTSVLQMGNNFSGYKMARMACTNDMVETKWNEVK